MGAGVGADVSLFALSNSRGKRPSSLNFLSSSIERGRCCGRSNA